MKFGQILEYNMRNIFLEKSYTKFGREATPRTFSRKSKLSIYLDQYSNVLYNFILIVCQVEDYRKRLKLCCWPFVINSYEAFLKNKEV